MLRKEILLSIFVAFFLTPCGKKVAAQGMDGETANTVGREFYVGIPLAPQRLSPVFELMIGTPFQQASYNVESSTGNISAGTVSSSASTVVTIRSDFEVTSSGFEHRMKGIRVRATSENPIYVLVTIRYPDFFVTGYGSYLVHPNYEFEGISNYEYFAMSTDYAGEPAIRNRRSNILLVGNSDETSISITPTQRVRLPQDAQTNSPIIEVAAGTTHNVTLNSLQTMGFSNILDLTGTKIVSDKPLTVLTGHQCAQVPITVFFCEPLYVHVPPTINWGQLFLLAPFAGRRADQQYKLVTSTNSTTIAYRCAGQKSMGLESSKAGDSFILAFPRNSYCYLTASSHVFMAQIAPGSTSDSMGDPAVAIVSPITGHVRSTSFLNLPSSVFPNNFITVTVQANHFNVSQIQLDGYKLNCTWTDIHNTINDNIVGYGCTTSVSTGTHTVLHSAENGVLSVVTYGWNARRSLGYAYLTGLNFNIPEHPTDVPEVIFEESLPFYSLSAIPGVTELPRTQDSNSGPIFIPDFLIYGNETISRVFVNENGAFSFNTPWMFSHPNRFPTTYLPTRQGHVLTPFWSDVDIRKEGTVRYVPIVRGSSDLGDQIMNEASIYINDHFIDEDQPPFRPTWVLVAQWDRVHPYPHGSDNHDGIDEEYLSKTNTFQGLIITDTIHSYYIVSFTCGEIQWSGQGSETAIFGYNSNGTYFFNHPANGFSDIGRIISCTRPIRQEGQRKKRQMSGGTPREGEFPVDKNKEMMTEECKKIADRDDESIKNINELEDDKNQKLTILPTCPQTRAQLEISSKEFYRFPPQGTNCYRSKNTFKPKPSFDNPLDQTYVFVSVCCYNEIGAIIRSGLDAGRITDIFSGGTENLDIKGFKANCCGDLHCSKYTDRRPLSPIAPEAGETRGAAGWGDPHYGTFDNKCYTSQAQGEYTLFGVTTPLGSEVFHLQGRLGPRGWLATTIVALAFGVPGVYGYQFVHNNQAVLLQTIPSVQPVDNVNNDRVQITLNGNSMTANIKVLNIRITATWYQDRQFKHINFHIFVPQFLCNISFGHLGNCNGSVSGYNENCTWTSKNDVSGSNDYRINITQTLFIYRNDTRKKREIGDEMPLNYTHEENNLKKRQISGPDFVCTSFDNCGDHNFVGVAFENLTFTEEQRVMCKNDRSCLYDLVVTGDEEYAATTLEASEENTRVQEIIRNNPPKITGGDIFRVNVGEENVYIFTVNDTNDFNVTIEGGAPEGGVLSDDGDGVYSFTWTPATIPTRELTFVAIDNAGAATVHSPFVKVCACFNGGECTEKGVPSTNRQIQILTCLCTEAYTGDSCSEDKNGCAEIECFSGVECFDIPAPGVGVECGSCEPGFTGDGLKCTDLDECATDNSLCDQICLNTFGSYMCTCKSGFMLAGNTCKDIDECSGVNDCQQDCTNTPGSFNCTCGPAFTLDMDGKTCNPRTTCGVNSCSHICAVVGGRDECFCPIGLELAAGSTTTCQDIDECKRFSPCDQICTNTEGSFECSCNTGFQLQNATRTCKDIDECRMAALEGSVICLQANTQCVNTNGSFECVCVGGYELVNAECERIINEVIEPPKVVVPMLGQENAITFMVETYKFNELTAERLQEFRVATAMAITRYCARNECVLITLDGPQRSLNVTVRSQHIAIPMSNIINSTDGRPVLTFYAQLNSETVVSSNVLMMAVEEAKDLYRNAGFLTDVDECQTSNGGCNQTCTNTDGSFECSCGTGYTLAENRLDCNDVDECQTSNGGCNQTCTNTDGSFECSCDTGYTLAENRLDCHDVDECQTGNEGCNQTCTNTDGSFECSCDTGYTLAENRLDCHDVDECQTGNGGCDQTCTNIDGSFECSCDTGYTLAENRLDCHDVDECQIGNGGCNQTCTNTVGSFECSCDTGYTLAENILDCNDIDECLTNNGGCAQICTNTHGSFWCSCRSGYIPNFLNCEDVNECQVNNGGCEETCINNQGSFECSCRPGRILAADGLTCLDVDECLINNGGCNQTCTNTIGSFECSCSTGYTLAPNNQDCLAGPPFSLKLINSSPRTSRNVTVVEFVPSKPLKSAICNLFESPGFDCSSGRIYLTHLSPGYHRLRIVTRATTGEKYVLRRMIFICDDNSCGVTLINEGVEVMGDCVRIQFTGCGAVQSFRCKLNKEPFKFCLSPVRYCGLDAGRRHRFQALPLGKECRRRGRVSTHFNILAN